MFNLRQDELQHTGILWMTSRGQAVFKTVAAGYSITAVSIIL